MQDDAGGQAAGSEYDVHRSILGGLQGGPAYFEWFGGCPTFHDSELREFDIRMREPSVARLLYWRLDEAGQPIDHHLVQIEIDTVFDVQFDGFAPQNVLWEVRFKMPVDRPERRPCYPYQPAAGDVEIEFDANVGGGGFILGRGVSLSRRMLRGSR